MMFMHVRLQLLYSHAWTCTLFESRWSARPWILSVRIQATIFVDYHDYYMTHSLDGCDHAWVHSSILTGWLRPCLGSRLLCTLLWMAVPIPHISCTWDISCTSLCRFSGDSVFICTCFCKAFHPSLSFGLHALGGIYYIVICHCFSPSQLPLSRTLEDSFRDLWEVTQLENTCIRFL